jgi:hypothetical protein
MRVRPFVICHFSCIHENTLPCYLCGECSSARVPSARVESAECSSACETLGRSIRTTPSRIPRRLSVFHRGLFSHVLFFSFTLACALYMWAYRDRTKASAALTSSSTSRTLQMKLSMMIPLPQLRFVKKLRQ